MGFLKRLGLYFSFFNYAVMLLPQTYQREIPMKYLSTRETLFSILRAVQGDNSVILVGGQCLLVGRTPLCRTRKAHLLRRKEAYPQALGLSHGGESQES